MVVSNKDYVICESIGQLGNQMFEYAAAATYAFKHNKKIAMVKNCPDKNGDVYCYFRLNEVFPDIRIDLLLENEEELREVFYREEDVCFVPEFYSINYNSLLDFDEYGAPNVYIQGFRQSAKYLDRKLCQKIFKFDADLVDRLREKYGDLSNVVSINVRRQDYAREDNIFKSPSKEWIEKCISLFPGHKFLFTSDDISWCKENFVGDEFIFSDEPGVLEDLCLASLCKHNVISNGTFGWWGAFLNQNEGQTTLYNSPWFDPTKGNFADYYEDFPDIKTGPVFENMQDVQL